MLFLVKVFVLPYNGIMLTEEKVAHQLLQTKKTLSVAESCTGGLLAHRLTNIPGSSAFLKAGIVSYSNDAKIKLLKVKPELIKKNGAVSPEVAMAMAQGAQKMHKTDFGIGITGIAGPDGGTKQKPLGLVYIAVHTREGETLCAKCQFKGTRANIKKQASTQALRFLSEFL